MRFTSSSSVGVDYIKVEVILCPFRIVHMIPDGLGVVDGSAVYRPFPLLEFIEGRSIFPGVFFNKGFILVISVADAEAGILNFIKVT